MSVTLANNRYAFRSQSLADTTLSAYPQNQVLLRETEKLLEEWKHPDPYRPPTAPGGMSLISVAWRIHDLPRPQATNGRETCPLAFFHVR